MVGSVIQTSYASCSDDTPVEFKAFSNYNCMISDPNPWANLYMGSSQYLCQNSQPHVLGYLGLHCSNPTSKSSLSTTCEAAPRWMATPKARFVSYSCTSKQPSVSQPIGWLYSLAYPSQDCTGRVEAVSGVAIGACYIGYSNTSEAVGSVRYDCAGYTVFKPALDCTGAIDHQTTNAERLDSCSSGGGPGNRITMGPSGYLVGGRSRMLKCSQGTALPPIDVFQKPIIEQRFSNDICYDAPVAFNAWEAGSTLSQGLGTANYACDAMGPIVNRTIQGMGISSYVSFLNTRCSYLNPVYNPGELLVYSSNMYSGCDAPVVVNQIGWTLCDVTFGTAAALVIAAAIFFTAVGACLYRLCSGKRSSGGLCCGLCPARGSPQEKVGMVSYDNEDVLIDATHKL